MGRIQQTIRQGKPIDHAETELYLGLVLLVQRLNDGVTALLKGAGLSQPQYNALRILRGAGAEGRTCNEITERMVHRVPDITRLLDRLEARGLISRRREEEDRRVVRVWITKGGLQLLAPLDGPLAALHERQLACLGEKRVKQFISLTEAALGALDSTTTEEAE